LGIEVTIGALREAEGNMDVEARVSAIHKIGIVSGFKFRVESLGFVTVFFHLIKLIIFKDWTINNQKQL
jgi:hypothetical protein